VLHKHKYRNKHIYPLTEGVQSQNNPVDGSALHPVKSVAASPQQVSLFLVQTEHLEQGLGKTKCFWSENTSSHRRSTFKSV